MSAQVQRHIGLFNATSIGVGAIVGGGILALAGTGFATAGPAAILAFALNGVIAVITAFSFAELASSNPQSGGTYSFARNTLTVGTAFAVGWIVWFASIVAAALYALGFGSFAVQGLVALGIDLGGRLGDPRAPVMVAVAIVGLCVVFLRRSPGSGGNLVNILKVIVFAVLIVGGAYVWLRTSPPAVDRLTPFMPMGATSVIAAMGFTFIAFQGFDLIAAVAGEIKDPRRVLPKAMMLSLGAALSIYIPLLFIVSVIGVPEGMSIGELSRESPDTIVAVAANRYLGAFGFWLVIGAGVLSMLSALLANLFAASRIARVMAGDRTLPLRLAALDELRGTPRRAIEMTGVLAIVILLAMGDVSRAGAASSLIFLISFCLTHLICILARKRRPGHAGFRVPAWPYLPAFGALVCGGLAVFQGIVVPAAGAIAGAWLFAGFLSYVYIFGKRARILDAASEYTDPELLQLRGRSPLVLVPIANPANAEPLAALGVCFSPTAGRVLMLNVIPPAPSRHDRRPLRTMNEVLTRSLNVSLESGTSRTEALISVAADPWSEIARVAGTHRCALTLLGMSRLGDEDLRERIEQLALDLPGNLAILRAPEGWTPAGVRRILVPLGGRGVHNALRARLLTALAYRYGGEDLEVRYLIVVPPNASEREQKRLQATWTDLVTDESTIQGIVEVMPHTDVVDAVVKAARRCDLIVLGLGQSGKTQLFGKFVLGIVEKTDGALLLIGQKE